MCASYTGYPIPGSALSYCHNIYLAWATLCNYGTEFNRPLSQPFHENHEILRCVSFSWNGRYIAYGGYDNKLTECTVEMAIASQLPAPILQQSDRRSTQSNSSLSSCLDVRANATGGDGFIEEVHDDPYNNFFQEKLVFFHPKVQTLTTSTCM